MASSAKALSLYWKAPTDSKCTDVGCVFPYGEADAFKGFSQAWRYSLDMARIVMPFGRVSFLSCNSHEKRGKEDGRGFKKG